MSDLTNNQLQLPQPGLDANWGSIINNNFLRIENKLREMANNINALESLTGSEMNYIRMQESAYFVNIYYANEQNLGFTWALEYLSKTNFNDKNKTVKDYGGTDVETLKSNSNVYLYTQEWETAPLLYTGAFVANIFQYDDSKDTKWAHLSSVGNTIGLPGSEIDGNTYETYERGDLLVRTQKFGSIYSTYKSVSFTKYPPLSEYHLPNVDNSNVGHMWFEKTNYVDYHLAEPKLNFYLPTLGLSSLDVIKYSGNNTWTANGGPLSENGYPKVSDGAISARFALITAQGQLQDNVDDYMAFVNWYQNDEQVYLQHIITKTKEINADETSGTITITITPDLTNIVASDTEPLYCYIQFTNRWYSDGIIRETSNA